MNLSLDVNIGAQGSLIARGIVPGRDNRSSADPASGNIQTLAEGFVRLRQAYTKSLANDGVVAGEERTRLMDLLDHICAQNLQALQKILRSQAGLTGNEAHELLAPEVDNAVFSLNNSTGKWQLRASMNRGPSTDTIRERLQLLSSGPLTALLHLVRDAAADRVITPEEEQGYLPVLVGLLAALVALRVHTESCVSSD